MAAHVGWLDPHLAGLYVGAALADFSDLPYAVGGDLRSGDLAGSRQDGFPDLVGDAWDGMLFESAWERFKDRIILAPETVEAGHITDPKVFMVHFWNAWMNAVAMLESFTVSAGEGIMFTGLEVSDTIDPLGGATLVLTVGIGGPLTINTRVELAFDLQTCVMRVSGSRGTVLIVPPLVRGYAEARRWDTHVFVSQNGRERRLARINSTVPPRTVTLPIATAMLHELMHVEHLLAFGLFSALGVPLWFSLARLTQDAGAEDLTIHCETQGRDFDQVEQVALIRADYSAFVARRLTSLASSSIGIDNPAPGFAAGDLVLPMIVATPDTSTRLAWLLDPFGDVSIEFHEVTY